LSEDVVLIRAMRDSNVPKFLRDDLPLFHAIVGDLFPGVVVPKQETGDLERAVRDQLRARGLQAVPLHIDKIMQLFDTFNVRFGVVITGPTTAGKTTAYQVLAKAMGQLRDAKHESENFQHVEINVLNPKCVTMGELYGEFNELTQEWVDGLASTMIRAAAMTESTSRNWTVFDGPIDALWPEMRMLFEVQDLEVASPATVSRLGVVYMTPDNLGWQPYVTSWLDREMPAEVPAEVKVRHCCSLRCIRDGIV
jgi:dynein heavy chain